MAPPRGAGPGNTFFFLVSGLACLFVAQRLWSTTRENIHLRQELRYSGGKKGSPGFPYMGLDAGAGGEEGVLFHSIRPSAGPATPLTGAGLAEDVPTQEGDEALMGQIDGVDAGEVTGWACLKGYMGKPLEVAVYVDGVRVGRAQAAGETPHHIIHRLCELDLARSELEGPPQQLGVGFRLKLPELPQGRHEVRAFVRTVDGLAKQELNQSPLPFIESAAQPGLEEALKRKDAIIRVRNAQISALWDELHTRKPWTNALAGDAPINLHADAPPVNASQPHYTLVIGINTGLGARVRREILRKTWVPMGKGLHALEVDHKVVVRFVVGYSEQKDDPDEQRIQEEIKAYGDIIRLDLVDTYADLSLKTLKMFSVLPAKYDADFYFKIDDDVAVNVPAMAAYLHARRNQGNLYLGCMKSGQVLTDRRYKWYEPEYWRFGDPASAEGQINYMRHASGQVYGLSGPVARYIGRNAPILHRFANEDVTLGAWLVGLEVTHVDERRLCCDSAERCQAQTSESNVCLSYYEHQCAGICSSESRLEPIFETCLRDPLHQSGAAVAESPPEKKAAAEDATAQQAELITAARRQQ